MSDILKFIPSPSFVTGDDGFVMWFPVAHHAGFSAHNLREIADELDRRNAAWAAEIDAYFAENPEVTP